MINTIKQKNDQKQKHNITITVKVDEKPEQLEKLLKDNKYNFTVNYTNPTANDPVVEDIIINNSSSNITSNVTNDAGKAVINPPLTNQTTPPATRSSFLEFQNQNLPFNFQSNYYSYEQSIIDRNGNKDFLKFNQFPTFIQIRRKLRSKNYN